MSLLPPPQGLKQLLLTSAKSRIFQSSTSYNARCTSFSNIRTYAKPSSKEYDPLKPKDLPTEEGEGEGEEFSVSQGAYDSWLETQGRRFQYPSFTGPKWLGGQVPFPLNPTFKPPPPLSDQVRKIIYEAYVSNPAANDLRVLSVRYGISIPRVEAILKLKTLEARWQRDSKTVQTGFQTGMESLLGVKTAGRVVSVAEELNSPLRDAVKEADETAAVTAAEAEAKGGQKHSLSRSYFEPVTEGEEPIVPGLIATSRAKAHEKANRIASTTTTSSLEPYLVRPDPNRVPFMFIDVGLKWFDSVDGSRRQKESDRRKKIKERKKEKAENSFGSEKVVQGEDVQRL